MFLDNICDDLSLHKAYGRYKFFLAHFFKGFENSQCSGFFFRSYGVSIVIIFGFNFKALLNCQIAISFSEGNVVVAMSANQYLFDLASAYQSINDLS